MVFVIYSPKLYEELHILTPLKKKTLQSVDLQGLFLYILMCTQRDSNSYRRYRKPKFYPLNYGCDWLNASNGVQI